MSSTNDENTSTIKTVDFIPTQNITGNLKKVSEYDIATYNMHVNAVITLLFMERGSNQLFPSMGCNDDLKELFLVESSDVFNIVERIQSNIKGYTGCDISVDTVMDTNDPELCHIKFTINGLPGSTTVDFNRSGKFIKIAKPSAFN